MRTGKTAQAVGMPRIGELYESLPHPFYVVDAKDYTVKFANSASGFGELDEKSFCYSLVYNRDEPCTEGEHVCPLEKVKKTKKPVVVEHLQYDKQGKRKVYEIHGYPIFDEKGNVVYMIEYSLNITRRKAQGELRILQEVNEAMNAGVPLDDVLQVITDRVKELFEFDACDIFLVQKGGRELRYAALSINKKIRTAIEKLTGLKAQNMRIPLFKGSIFQQTIEERKTHITRDMVKSFKDYSDKKVVRAFAGQAAKVSGIKATIRVPLLVEDEIIGIMGAARKSDITADDARALELFGSHVALIIKKARAEQALRESEERFRSISVSAKDAIIMVDNQGQISFWNPASEQIFGYSEREAIGAPVQDLLLPAKYHKLYNRVFDFFSRTGKIKTGGRPLALETIKKDGAIVPVELSASPLVIRGKWHVAAIIRDLSEKKLLESQLQQSQRLEAIGQLAGSIAHDFNNILNIINTHAEMALMELDKKVGPYRDIEQLLKASEKAENMVRQILVFGRRQKVRPKLLSVNKALSDVQKMVRPMMGEDIEIEMRLAADLPVIKADPSQFEQVIVNLLVNARDALNQLENKEAVKKITVTTGQVMLDEEYVSTHVDSRAGPHILIAVSDSGVGMDRDILDKIFDPFFTTKRASKGTGLGLSTVYGIVKQHKGSISVSSRPGEGSTFKIFWPALK